MIRYDFSDVLFQMAIYQCTKAGWDNFRSYISETSFSACFRNRASRKLFLVHLRTESLILHKKSPSQTWFTLKCSAVIAHRNYYYYLYQRDRHNRTITAFRTVRNHCKRSGYAKSIDVQAVGAKVESKTKTWLLLILKNYS